MKDTSFLGGYRLSMMLSMFRPMQRTVLYVDD